MKRNELIRLRELIVKEENRRKRIKELLKREDVLEYLELLDLKPADFNDDILKMVLKDFNVTKTNGIYVCTNAYYVDYDICYEETNYYTREVEIDSEYAEHRIYTDIESGDSISSSKEKDNWNRPLMSDFERDNIVLNPTNSSKNRNNYDQVRMDFFDSSINKGQSYAKKLILSKYNRM